MVVKQREIELTYVRDALDASKQAPKAELLESLGGWLLDASSKC